MPAGFRNTASFRAAPPRALFSMNVASVVSDGSTDTEPKRTSLAEGDSARIIFSSALAFLVLSIRMIGLPSGPMAIAMWTGWLEATLSMRFNSDLSLPTADSAISGSSWNVARMRWKLGHPGSQA